MQKKITIACVLACIIMTSCTPRLRASFSILDGTLAWARQDWTRSTTVFLRTANSEIKDLSAWANYGLASTYLAQEEYDAAMRVLSTMGDPEDTSLQSGLWYQAGIAAWRKGMEEDASRFFRKSLEIDPASIDAKINLELIAVKRREQKAARSGSSPSVSRKDSEDTGNDALFNYVRKMEEDRWKQTPDEQLRNPSPDY